MGALLLAHPTEWVLSDTMSEENTQEEPPAGECTITIDDASKNVGLDKTFIPEAEELGITFGCQDGICGTCIVEVEEGMRNLGEKNTEEIDMSLEDNQRLVCQCKFKKPGKVKMRY